MMFRLRQYVVGRAGGFRYWRGWRVARADGSLSVPARVGSGIDASATHVTQ